MSKRGNVLEEVAAVLSLTPRGAFVISALPGGCEEGDIDLGLCAAEFEELRIRALINEGTHEDDKIPMSYGHMCDLREVEAKAAEIYDS
jgi:hypothetical protein